MTTTTSQLYNATNQVLLDCGSSSATTSDRKWDGDYHSEFVPSNITTTSFSSTPDYLDPSVPRTPYSTSRIFNSSSFTYTFPVSEGPKFLRLYFYPATYSNLNANQSFFSVSSNGYSLLTNFSAFLTASFLVKSGSIQVPCLVKEFLIQVKDTQTLTIMFTPMPNSYAFINGIEVVSMPENLYFNGKAPKYVNQLTGPGIDSDTALENVYRLNMGGRQVSGNEDTGMYRSRYQDNKYIFGAAVGCTSAYSNPIIYNMDTPNYTAPELVYQTQRRMCILADKYNLTWILPVDSGFYYMLRLHVCNIIPEYTNKINLVVFNIFINNQTAENEADPFIWNSGIGNPIFKDYIKSDVYSFGVVLFEVLCARPPIVKRVRDGQVNLAEWGKTCYGNGDLLEIIDPKLNGEIAPGCLMKFGEVASSCLHDEGGERPAMEEVVWGLEFALELQEAAEKKDGHDETMPENQEISFLM
ncbi:hypothetical protein L1987_46818 [Smallanthus sonchifolius]|uniref:Uncharacterized protein n=1 Tax=Smallanthus sonchifolius TaxID=185202 RepID=A0ACB9G1T9_9ASTR|nr:hypothetical protein L1987_46818 [Smallanthus sonchifolius]